MPENIEDLDILRPAKKFIKLNGKEIDVSFVPTGITFDIADITKEMANFDIKKIEAGGAEAKEAFNLAVKLCACFCLNKHPEMDETWLLQNTDVVQIRALSDKIKKLLTQAYAGVEEYGKNELPTESKKK